MLLLTSLVKKAAVKAGTSCSDIEKNKPPDSPATDWMHDLVCLNNLLG